MMKKQTQNKEVLQINKKKKDSSTAKWATDS